MDQVVSIALANNVALLLVLSIIYEFSYVVPSKYQRFRPFFNGVLISLICLIIMLMPFTLTEGIVFDTRSILISVTALMFGPIPALLTVITASVTRIIMGGSGTWTGLAVIFSSALIGLAWRRWLYPKFGKWRWLNIYMMSLIVHGVMLLCTLLIPYPVNLTVINQIAAPVMIMYPLASVALGLLLLRQQARRRIEEQLAQSEARFQQLFNQAPLGYQSLDIDGKIIDVNQMWLDTLGYDRNEVVGNWFGDFLAPNYRDAFRKRFPIFKAQGQIQSEFEMVRKDGRHLFIAFDGKIGYDLQGDFKQTHCILQDISERRIAELSLQESEEKHRRLFETMAQGVLYQDPEGKIISANPAAQRILGMTLEQMQDKTSLDPAWQTVSEDGIVLSEAEHPVMIAIHTGQPVGPVVMGVINYQLQEPVWLMVNAIPLFQPGEKTPFQVYSTFQDITAERKASQNYRRLFDQMIDAFAVHEIICDQQGNPIDYRFLDINSAFEKMTGLKTCEIIGHRALEIIPDIKPHWIQTYGRVALTGEAVAFEDFSVAMDKYFAISAYQSAAKQFACTYTDITKRVKAENALKASEYKYFSYIENAPDAVFVTDENGHYVEANKAASQITGYSNAELMQMTVRDITAEESLAEALTHFESMQVAHSMKAELQFIRKDGSKRWWTVDAIKLSDHRYLGFSIDITDRKKAEKELLHLSYHDYLTDLYNRTYYDQALKDMDSAGYLPLSIIVGDINGLKLINDAFGHQEGDQLIRETAKLLLKNCREQDILARTGGDEFSIILPRTNSREAYEMLKKLENACSEYNDQIVNEAFHLSISIGFDTRDSLDQEVNKVIKSAQGYMNQRKLLESKSSHSTIIASIKATMLENSHETEAHAERLVTASRKIGKTVGLSEDDLNHLELFSMLHDIGKIGISDQILNKTGQLTDEDWTELKKHPAIGYRIAMSTPELASIADLILSHHERWDGKGYPRNLKGEEIPLLSRILSIVDSYDAMTHDRSYRSAMSAQDAIAEIERNMGSQFDPIIAKLFIDLFSDK